MRCDVAGSALVSVLVLLVLVVAGCSETGLSTGVPSGEDPSVAAGGSTTSCLDPDACEGTSPASMQAGAAAASTRADAGPGREPAPSPPRDAGGEASRDGGAGAGIDAGVQAASADAGSPPVDAGTPPVDAASAIDGGVPPVCTDGLICGSDGKLYTDSCDFAEHAPPGTTQQPLEACAPQPAPSCAPADPSDCLTCDGHAVIAGTGTCGCVCEPGVWFGSREACEASCFDGCTPLTHETLGHAVETLGVGPAGPTPSCSDSNDPGSAVYRTQPCLDWRFDGDPPFEVDFSESMVVELCDIFGGCQWPVTVLDVSDCGSHYFASYEVFEPCVSCDASIANCVFVRVPRSPLAVRTQPHRRLESCVFP